MLHPINRKELSIVQPIDATLELAATLVCKRATSSTLFMLVVKIILKKYTLCLLLASNV